MPILLYLAFFLSGGAGLVYETIWSRYLGLFVGHTAYAQVIVLTIFLGGLSLGAILVGERSERTRRPLLWYAGAELGVGVYALFFHDLFLGLQGFAYGTAFPALAGSSLLTPVKWALVGGLILPPSVLLGTTFPFMSAGFLRRFPGPPGRILSLLYFSNSLGAAVGALVAGFLLLGMFGLPGALLSAAVLNFLVAILAWAVDRRSAGVAPSVTEPEVEAQGPGEGAGEPLRGTGPRTLWRLLLGVSFGTALASFIYEIAWIRMLSLVLGTATHSFEIMLSAFILGLALGAFWMRKRADRISDPIRTLGWIQWVMGASALATLPVYVASFGWTAELLSALARTPQGYTLFNMARYGVALAVMLPATFCAGTTLPLITRTLLSGGEGERAIGWVYGVNTLGSIVGVVLASLVLLPLVGLQPLLVLGGTLDMALGVVLLTGAALWFRAGDRPRGRRPAVGAAVGMGAVALLALLGVHLDRALLTSGVYRTGRLPGEEIEILYYEDGRTATVSADRRPPGVLNLATNGKPDATLTERWLLPPDTAAETARAPLSLDEPTQVLLSLVTLAHNPMARSGVVVGQGSGLSSQLLLGSPELASLVTVEIEPAMLEGSRIFLPATRRVFEDPRARFVIDDAKSFLARGGPPVDIILSEPSNPWVSGVSSLFTAEFYGRVRERLAPGGVFGQWIHLYEIDDALVLSVLAAIHQVFPDYAVFLVHASDMLIVACADAVLPPPDWSVFEFPGVRQDLAHTYPFPGGMMESARFLTREALEPLLDDWAYGNSDFFPILDLGAERTRFLRDPALGFLEAAGGPFDLADVFLPPAPEIDAGFLAPVPQIPMVRALALRSRMREALAGVPRGRGTGSPDPAGPLPNDPELEKALYRLQKARALVELSGAPGDWATWLQEVVEGAGWSAEVGWRILDPDLLARAAERAAALGAPEPVDAALLLLPALDARDWAAVERATELLAPTVHAGEAWLPAAFLLEAGVAARLALGRGEEGAEYFRRIGPRAGLSREDLRIRLLMAHLDRALGLR